MQFGAMTPGEIEEAKRKIGEYKPPQEPERLEVGYRGWGVRFEGGVPKLFSLGRRAWEPAEGGEVVSDYKEGEDPKFEHSSKGFYSKASLQELLAEYPNLALYGAIFPYGKVAKGTHGFRSTKAKVASLFRSSPHCYICGKLAKYYLHDDYTYAVCGGCYKRLEKVLTKGEHGPSDIEEVLRKLAETYSAEIVEFPQIEGTKRRGK